MRSFPVGLVFNIHIFPYFVFAISEGSHEHFFKARIIYKWIRWQNFQRNTQKRLIQIENSISHRGYKTIFILNSAEQIYSAHKKLKYQQMKKFLAFSLSDVVFIRLINVKMPTIVGILTFMSSINSILSWVEHEKSFITSGPDARILNSIIGHVFGCYQKNSI